MRVVVVFFHFALIFAIAFLSARRWGESKNKLYWTAFFSHLTAAMALGLVYQYYYSANDTWEFFTRAVRFADLAKQDWSSYLKLLIDFDLDQSPYFGAYDFRSVVFIKILSLFCLFANSNYWVVAGYFAWLSFVASWCLFKRITIIFTESKAAAAMAFLFFPSVVFWSSGIVKETLALASLYLLTHIFLQFYDGKKIDGAVMLLALFAGALLWILKYYWAGVFLIAAIPALALQFLQSKNIIRSKFVVISYIIAFVFTAEVVSLLHPNFYPHRFLEVLVTNYEVLVKLSNGSNVIHYHQLNASVESILINSPWALVSGIFRPFIGEGEGILAFAASVENLVVLVLFISFLWRLRKRHNPITVLTLAAISYCIVLCIFLALSTPNFGTLSRYRVGFLPFLTFLFAYRNSLVDWIMRKFSR